MVEAKYYTPEKNMLRCNLCPVNCLIAQGRLGRCLGRKNIDGKLFAINYGAVVSMAIDPMEKKPLYHFYPGTQIFSVATYGCNLRCPFCQNWEISQVQTPARYIEPDELVKICLKYQSMAISYTYTEPLIWFEYLLAAGTLAHQSGIKNVLVTNGLINQEPLKELLPLIDAMNIDLKSIRSEFYEDFIKGDLETVLDTIRIAKKSCHIELTNLIIPTKNDSEEEIKELVSFVANLGKDTPLHFSRYFPNYKVDIPATPIETIYRAYEIAKARLDFVYIGNVHSLKNGNNTYCPNCNNLLVSRSYFSGRVVGIKDGMCNKCLRKIPIITSA